METLRLLKLAQRGDLQAFNQLVLDHQEVVYNLAWRLLGDAGLAEKVTNETFREVYRELPGANGLGVESGFPVLLYRHLARCCRSAQNRRNGFKLRHSDYSVALDSFQARLLALPFDQRLAVLLVDLADLKYREAALVLAAPVAAVRSYVARARQSLAVHA